MLSDVVLEVARAVVMAVILAFMVVVGHRQDLYDQRGYGFIVGGFGLLLFGALLDITDNYDALDRFVVIGDTHVEAFLEKVVGYLLGFVLLFAGFWYWLPLVGDIRRAEQRLQNYSKDLEVEVARRTEDLQRTNERLQESQDRIASANRLIVDSIRYASRIQNAILPAQDAFASASKDHFLIWEPRDVVGGDFFWCQPVQGGHVVMVGDCTGHGVPGAFMTLIACGLLDRILQTVPLDEPSRVLGELHRGLQALLGQDQGEGETDDGLEAGVCFVGEAERRLVFSGARLSLWRTNGGSVDEIKGDKAGIGYRRFARGTKFSDVPLELTNGSAFYLTTDGLIDQVGGPRRIAFGKKRFVAFITEHQTRPMPEQAEALRRAVAAYQGSEPRRDDLTVLGFTPRAGR